MKNFPRFGAALLAAALLGVLAGEGRAATYRPAAATSPAGTVPNVINYQGRLVDNGFPVTGLRNVSFRLYDALTGPVNLLWSSGAQTVAVSQGLFGTTLAISTQALAGPTQKFLEVQVDAQVLSPREPLNAVPYALVAKSLEDNVNVSSVSVGTTLISSGTLAVASIQALNGSGSFSILSPMVFAGGVNLGLGTNNPATLLHMSSGTLTIDGNAAVAMTAVGNVGVGISGTPPNAKLQVANSASAGPGSPDLIVGNGFPSSGGNTQLSVYRGAAFGSYVGMDAYHSGAGGAPLILNGANGGSVGVGVTSFSPGALLDVDGNAQFGSVGTKSVFSSAGALTLAANAALTASGAGGNVISAASVTASGFFGSSASIGAVNAATKMHMSSGTLTIDGNAVNAIVTTGRVGIGLTPTNPLSVSGNANVTGTLTAGSFSGAVSGNATSATNIANGLANQIPYQSGAGATTFVAAPGANVVLFGNSGAPSWTNTPTFNGSNLTSLTAANISAGTAGINISGNAATVTTNANLTGNVTSVGNATTIASIPAVSGANLTSLTAANISAGTAGINITGNAGTAHIANGGEQLTSMTKAALSAVTPTAVGQVFFCNNCAGAVGATGKIVVSTGTSAGNFADAAGGLFQ